MMQVSELTQTAYDKLPQETKDMLTNSGRKLNLSGPEILERFGRMMVETRTHVELLCDLIPLLIPNRKTALVSLQTFINLQSLNAEELEMTQFGAKLVTDFIGKRKNLESN